MNDGNTTTRSFDIGNEKDLITLLHVIRHSVLSPEEKDQIRDAVFMLGSRANPLLLRGLQSTLDKLNIVVTQDVAEPKKEISTTSAGVQREVVTEPVVNANPGVVEAVEVAVDMPAVIASKPLHGFGFMRHTPSFVATSAGKSVAVAMPEVLVDQASSQVEIPTSEVKLNIIDSIVVPETVAEQPRVIAAEPIVSAPVIAAVAPVVTSVPEPEAAPVAVPQAAAMTSESALNRIKEIKQKVNSVVGNPVNLISKNEVVGKEYMTTLLEAMRVATADGDVSTVMRKLEAIYMRVQQVLEDRDALTPPAIEEPSPAQGPASIDARVAPLEVPDPALITNTVMHTDTQAVDIANVDAVLAAADAALKQTSIVAPVETATTVVTSTPVTVVDQVVEESSVAPSVSVVAKMPEYHSVKSGADQGTVVPMKKIMTTIPVTPVVPAVTDRFQAVTAQPSVIDKQRQVFEQYKQQQKIADTNDPFHSEAVTQGLGMLLSEWSLFKKSGLLGTGPKGISHPLYKQIHDLKMNLIVSGRFEGATPAVRQSIIDYMNGWRYEHGIVHEMDESFEQYLRRIIYTILEKQKTNV